MRPLSKGVPALGGAVGHVVGGGAEEQMIRSNTVRDIAVMTHI
jgi:hypothetical protein